MNVKNHHCDYTYQILGELRDSRFQDILHIRICRECAKVELQNLETQEWNLVEDVIEEEPEKGYGH